jgi:hypothetical protein
VVLDLATHRHEDRLVVADQRDDVLAWDVGGGDDDRPRPIERVVALDREEARVGLGGADGRAEPGAWEDQVVGVFRLAGELFGSLAAEGTARPCAPGHRAAGLDDEGVRRGRGGTRRCGSDGHPVRPPASPFVLGARAYHRDFGRPTTAPDRSVAARTHQDRGGGIRCPPQARTRVSVVHGGAAIVRFCASRSLSPLRAKPIVRAGTPTFSTPE